MHVVVLLYPKFSNGFRLIPWLKRPQCTNSGFHRHFDVTRLSSTPGLPSSRTPIETTFLRNNCIPVSCTFTVSFESNVPFPNSNLYLRANCNCLPSQAIGRTLSSYQGQCKWQVTSFIHCCTNALIVLGWLSRPRCPPKGSPVID